MDSIMVFDDELDNRLIMLCENGVPKSGLLFAKAASKGTLAEDIDLFDEMRSEVMDGPASMLVALRMWGGRLATIREGEIETNGVLDAEANSYLGIR